MMKITVRLFAILRERVGISEITLDLPPGSSVANVRDALIEKHPALSSLLARVAYAVNRNYAPIETVLRDGDEVALIPPVSGG
jgi:molybdopterin converting factor subunit 1